MKVICQVIGIIAMVLSVTSFQLKTKKQIITMQCMTGVVFAIHYFMLPNGAGAAGCVVNLIAIVRNLVFYFNYKPIFKSKLWVVFFAIVMGGSAIVSRPEPISIFMCIAMIFNTLAVSAKAPVGTRKMILISSPFAFVYNVAVLSVGGMANEALVEIITAITYFKETRSTKNDREHKVL